MLRTSIRKTKREIFYCSPKIFGNQYTVDRYLSQFLKKHELTMSDLNIAPSLKGLFYGTVWFTEKPGNVNIFNEARVKNLHETNNTVKDIVYNSSTTNNGYHGAVIDYTSDIISTINSSSINTLVTDTFMENEYSATPTDGTRVYALSKDLIPDMTNIVSVDCSFNDILVIEKDSFMTFIIETYKKNKRTVPFLLITGKGYPDYNTTNFIMKFKNKRIFGLFDLDPHGLNIYRVYKQRLMYIYRIGILSKDIHLYKVKKEDLLSLTERDHKLLYKLQEDTSHPVTFYDDIDFLQGLNKKMEIEIFTYHDILMDYLESKINELYTDEGMVVSPVSE